MGGVTGPPSPHGASVVLYSRPDDGGVDAACRHGDVHRPLLQGRVAEQDDVRPQSLVPGEGSIAACGHRQPLRNRHI